MFQFIIFDNNLWLWDCRGSLFKGVVRKRFFKLIENLEIHFKSFFFVSVLGDMEEDTGYIV